MCLVRYLLSYVDIIINHAMKKFNNYNHSPINVYLLLIIKNDFTYKDTKRSDQQSRLWIKTGYHYLRKIKCLKHVKSTKEGDRLE